MLSLKPFRSKAEGMPDILNYGSLIDEGVILGKDGSFIAGFFYTPGDDASATNAERNYVSKQANSYLKRFGSGWCMWVDAVRLPSPGYPERSRSHFPDPISAMIDEERRQMFEREGAHYETEYAIVFQYKPPSERETEMFRSFIDDNTGTGVKNYVFEQELDSFQKRLGDFHDGVKELLNMRRMGAITVSSGVDEYLSDELVNYLHFTLTGDVMALRVPACTAYLDSWLGYPSLYTGTIPKINDRYIVTVAIEGFPPSSHPGMLSLFDSLEVPFRWSSRYIFLDEHEALAEMGKYHRVWRQTIRSLGAQVQKVEGIINSDSLKMARQVEQAMSDVRSGAVVSGFYTPVVVMMNEDQDLLLRQAAYVKKVIESRGFHARVENVNAMEAWHGSLPGHPYPNVRRPLVHTLNLADLLPLSGIWPGLRENPCGFYPEGSPPLMQVVTTGATPFRFNLHDGDVGHTLIFGPTGAGKSTQVALILAQFRRYESKPRPDGSAVHASITAFDKGRSLYALSKALGGRHYDIGADDVANMTLCPLADLDSASAMLWAEEWIGTCYQLQTNEELNPEQKNEVHRALTQMRAAPKAHRSLTHFNSTVQKSEIRAAMKHYTNKGSMGHLLDGEEDPQASNFVVYEIDELMSLGEKNAIPVLLYLFRLFEKTLTGQPAILALGEAWAILGRPMFREKLREWLKELRKKNCAVVIDTQSLSDAVSSGIIDTLLEQCPTKIFLPNKDALSEGTAEHPGPAVYYKIFGLNDNEMSWLSTATYKLDYYLKCSLGRRPYRLGLGPLALCFVAVSDKDAIRKIKALEAEHGEDWPIHWMIENGVDYAKYTG